MVDDICITIESEEQFGELIKTGRNIVTFVQDNCPPCEALKRDLTTESDFGSFLRKYGIRALMINLESELVSLRSSDPEGAPYMELYSNGELKDTLIGYGAGYKPPEFVIRKLTAVYKLNSD